jgi:hypothetical protein
MDLDDLTPALGGSLRGPITPRVSEPVATFTPTGITHPDQIWSPRGSEIGPQQRPLTQPAQFGRSIEHEPVNTSERTAQGTVQTIADHAAGIRAALRPGSF